MLQDGGHCGCVPGGEGTPHPETRQCAHCGKLSMVAFDLQTNFDNYAMEARKGQLLQLPSTVCVHCHYSLHCSFQQQAQNIPSSLPCSAGRDSASLTQTSLRFKVQGSRLICAKPKQRMQHTTSLIPSPIRKSAWERG